MFNWRHAISAAVFGIAAYAGSGVMEGHAADMSLFGGDDDPSPQTKVEFGTGWYIRGDTSWAFDKAPLLSSTLTYSDNQVRNNWSVDLGAGYKFNNWFRSDLTLGAWGPQRASGSQSVNCYSSINNVVDANGNSVGVYAVPNSCNANQQADIKKYAMLLNGYVDLGTWYGVTPFIGAGVGAALVEQESSVTYTNASDGSPYNANLVLPVGVNSNPTFLQGPALTQKLNPQPVINYGVQNWNRSYRTIKYNFAWALMAGFAYNLTENATLELGYRYVNFGQITGTDSVTGAPISKNLSAQEVRLGLRYLIDGM